MESPSGELRRPCAVRELRQDWRKPPPKLRATRSRLEVLQPGRLAGAPDGVTQPPSCSLRLPHEQTVPDVSQERILSVGMGQVNHGAVSATWARFSTGPELQGWEIELSFACRVLCPGYPKADQIQRSHFNGYLEPPVTLLEL
jgi:hypothetical protein